MKSLPAAICALDQNLKIIFATTRFEQLLACANIALRDVALETCSTSIAEAARWLLDAPYINEREGSGAFRIDDRVVAGRWMLSRIVKEDIENAKLWLSLKNCYSLDSVEELVATVNGDAAFLRSLLDQVASPVFVKDKKHSWVYGNDAFWSLLSARKECSVEKTNAKHVAKSAYLGKKDADLLPEETYRAYRKEDERVIHQNEMIATEEQIATLDGESLTVLTKKAPIELPGGRPGLVGLIGDVTEFKKAQSEAERYHRESIQKSTFLANMSHELRTPMNAIMGMTQLLDGTSLTDDQKSYVDIILTGADSLLHLLDEILDLSLIESGGMTLKEKPVDLVELVNDVAALLKVKADEKQLSLTTAIEAAQRRSYMADGGRVRQILVNLVNNAIKFTAAGSVHIHVSGAKDRVRFSVRDTGAGIRPENQKSIFDRFHQLDGTLTRKHGGAGLGLALCSELVSLMDGDIGVESVYGEGSNFWFEIPLEIAEPVVEAETAPVEQNCAPGATGAHVLVCEDNPVNQKLTVECLNMNGCSSDLAGDGAAALEALFARSYDAVMLDIQMPGVNGGEILEKLRAAPGPNQHTPVLVLTADAMVGAKEQYLALGADAYMSKPMGLDEFSNTLNRLLAKPDQGPMRAAG